MIDMEELLLGEELPQGGDNLLLVLVSHIQSNVACNTVQVPQRPPPDWHLHSIASDITLNMRHEN